MAGFDNNVCFMFLKVGEEWKIRRDLLTAWIIWIFFFFWALRSVYYAQIGTSLLYCTVCVCVFFFWEAPGDLAN